MLEGCHDDPITVGQIGKVPQRSGGGAGRGRPETPFARTEPGHPSCRKNSSDFRPPDHPPEWLRLMGARRSCGWGGNPYIATCPAHGRRLPESPHLFRRAEAGAHRTEVRYGVAAATLALGEVQQRHQMQIANPALLQVLQARSRNYHAENENIEKSEMF